MSTELLASISGNLIGLVACLSYMIYCLANQRVFIRSKGWRTKDEAPGAYKFTIGLMLFIALGSLGALLYRIYAFYEL
jgi:hypothetical protein